MESTNDSKTRAKIINCEDSRLVHPKEIFGYLRGNDAALRSHWDHRQSRGKI